MFSTVRGVYRDGHVELEEPPPRSEARVLVTFLADEQVAEGREPRPEGSPPKLPNPGWSQEFIDFLRDNIDDLTGTARQ